MIYKLIIGLLITFQCFAVDMTAEQLVILDRFFHYSLEKTEGGYVLYDQKPLCIKGFHFTDEF